MRTKYRNDPSSSGSGTEGCGGLLLRMKSELSGKISYIAIADPATLVETLPEPERRQGVDIEPALEGVVDVIKERAAFDFEHRVPDVVPA